MIGSWRRNAAWRQYKLRSHPLYWSVRKAIQDVWFRCQKFLFARAFKIRELYEGTSIITRLGWSVARDCCFAVLTAAGIARLDLAVRAHAIAHLSQTHGQVAQGLANFFKAVHLNQGDILTLLS